MEIKSLGQVFTPDHIIQEMIKLKQNNGLVLEPSCGDGRFKKQFDHCIGIEIDSKICPPDVINMDFFDYPTSQKFNTIIGNPPYVAFNNILPGTLEKLDTKRFDRRTNLYIFFIDKCIDHLDYKGELIFITPRDFLKATSAAPLNEKLYKLGTITHYRETGDERIFGEFNPNCLIWRFQKDVFGSPTVNLSTNELKMFDCINGQIIFSTGTNRDYDILGKYFDVKVGAVSGLDELFFNEKHGNADFVYSQTYKTGKTRKAIMYDKPNEYLLEFKTLLSMRKIRKFTENDWWQWGRMHHVSDAPRIYVNVKTRNSKPFFTHSCKNYDGSILALFPKFELKQPLEEVVNVLNSLDWEDMGFVCDGRYLFGQKSLESAVIPRNIF